MSTHTTNRTHHIVPLRTYLAVGGALFLLTGITVSVSLIPLGGWNVVVALGVASIKASLVALIFMHLRYDRKIYSVVFVAALLFVAILIIFTMFDTLRRDDIYGEMKGPIQPNAILYDDRQDDEDSAAVGHGESVSTAADSATADSAGGR